MFIVGLTGGIATGKSTVSRIFKDLGCPVVDADEIAREVVKPYQPAWKALVQNFGKDILLPNEEIDREKLGKIVFGDDVKRRVLNRCTHPAIYSSIWWALLKYFVKGEKFVILDLPLLYESGVSLFLMKDVIVVYCDRATQLQRLMERNNFTQSDAELRINAQMSLDEKCKRASYIIDNSSNQETTENLQIARDVPTDGIKAYHEVRIHTNTDCIFEPNMASIPNRRLMTFLSIIVWMSNCWAEDGFRICFQETEGSSQCQGPKHTCSGWSSNPAWTQSFRDDTDNRGGGCNYQWKIEAHHNIQPDQQYRLCFQETEGSSQCQGTRSSCTGWSQSPSWTQYFRDDTDNRGGGCRYAWKIESKPASSYSISTCRVCFKETEGSSQCQGNRESCSGWSAKENPEWTLPFRDDTDNRGGGCAYYWYLDCQYSKCGAALNCPRDSPC